MRVGGVSWRTGVWMVRGRSWCRVAHLHADVEELAEPRVEPPPERDVEAGLDEVAARALVREVARLDVVVLVPLRQQRHPQLVERPVAQRLDRVADRRVALVDPRVRRRADREVRAAVGVHERAAVVVHAHRARAGVVAAATRRPPRRLESAGRSERVSYRHTPGRGGMNRTRKVAPPSWKPRTWTGLDAPPSSVKTAKSSTSNGLSGKDDASSRSSSSCRSHWVAVGSEASAGADGIASTGVAAGERHGTTGVSSMRPRVCRERRTRRNSL